MSYTVEVFRENDAWIADVTNLEGAHTYAKSATALQAAVNEVIRLVADLDDDAEVKVHYSYVNVTDEFLEAARLGEEREALESQQRRLQLAANLSAVKLSAAGWSVRDISGALKLSPGRVSQITKEHAQSAP